MHNLSIELPERVKPFSDEEPTQIDNINPSSSSLSLHTSSASHTQSHLQTPSRNWSEHDSFVLDTTELVPTVVDSAHEQIFVRRTGHDIPSYKIDQFDKLTRNSKCPTIKWESSRQHSNVWKHFIAGLNHRGYPVMVCLQCKKSCVHPARPSRPKARGNLTTLKEHYQECVTKNRTATMPDFFSRGQSREMYSESRLQDAILSWVVLNNISYRSLNSPTFKDMIEMAGRSSTHALKHILTRKTAAENMHSKAQAAREELKKHLALIKSQILISLDRWTSPNNIAFVGIVAHFINNDFVLRREVLGFDVVEGSHTGKTYAALV